MCPVVVMRIVVYDCCVVVCCFTSIALVWPCLNLGALSCLSLPPQMVQKIPECAHMVKLSDQGRWERLFDLRHVFGPQRQRRFAQTASTDGAAIAFQYKQQTGMTSFPTSHRAVWRVMSSGLRYHLGLPITLPPNVAKSQRACVCVCVCVCVTYRA